MAVITEAFDVPPEIASNIAKGLYRRTGGVVRWAVGANKGQIVKHLKPVDVAGAEQARSVGGKLLQVAKQNKVATVVVLGAGVVATASVLIYRRVTHREHPAIVQFRLAFDDYLKSVREGNLQLVQITELRQAIATLKQFDGYREAVVQLTADDLEALVDIVSKYTEKLANDNNVELPDYNRKWPFGRQDKLTTLDGYLANQQTIFEKAS